MYYNDIRDIGHIFKYLNSICVTGYSCSLSVDLYRGKETKIDGTGFRSSCGELGCASSCACILYAVHPVSLGILRVETGLEK